MLLGFDLLKQVNVVEMRHSGQCSLSTQMFQLCWAQASWGGTQEGNAIELL